jgi:hypothetical protein
MNKTFKQSALRLIKSLRVGESALIELQENITFDYGMRAITSMACRQKVKVAQTSFKGLKCEHADLKVITFIKIECLEKDTQQ